MKTLREYIDQLDEISRRDFLKGAGATAGLAAAGGISYLGGKVSVYKQKVATAMGFIEEFESRMPIELRSDDQFSINYGRYSWWAKRLDTDLRTTDDYKRGQDLARQELNRYTKPYSELAKRQMLDSFKGVVDVLVNNAGYISNLKVPAESVDETASPDAVKRIEQLVQYK